MFPLSLWLLPQSNSWQSPDPWETWGWTFWAPSTAPLETPLLVKAEFPDRRRRFPRMSVFHIWSGWQWDLWPWSRQHINTALNNKTIIASFNSDNVDNCLFLSSKSSLFMASLISSNPPRITFIMEFFCWIFTTQKVQHLTIVVGPMTSLTMGPNVCVSVCHAL